MRGCALFSTSSDSSTSFRSSTEWYRAGAFDKTLLLMLERYDAIMAIMLPSLREERAATYSPFLPIHPRPAT